MIIIGHVIGSAGVASRVARTDGVAVAGLVTVQLATAICVAAVVLVVHRPVNVLLAVTADTVTVMLIVQYRVSVVVRTMIGQAGTAPAVTALMGDLTTTLRCMEVIGTVMEIALSLVF